MTGTRDVLILGGGIIGCAIAHRLAKEGVSVTLVERGEIGREASWAAGGILTPVHLAEYPTPLASLCLAGMPLYEPFVKELGESSKEDLQFRTCGMLITCRDEGGEKEARHLEAWKHEHHLPAERLTREEALRLEPGLSPEIRSALLLPDIAQIRNNRLTRAVADAARRRGARILPRTRFTAFITSRDRVTGARTAVGDLAAGTVILATGAWSGEWSKELGFPVPVRPVKGQILLAQASPGFCRHIVLESGSYLVPRVDGRLLIGSTVEEAGFDTTVTLDAVHHLSGRAASMMPAARALPLIGSWAGLRPATPDRLPLLGRTPVEGLLLATGHFRNGILLAPITAEIVTDLVHGRTPAVDLRPFDPVRKMPE
ncbi:MAG: glycine oxidase ThiO [Planctomycetes bacterium]|nr:glycine oxidase ThiO [Planctomycetota bacterium]